MKGIIGWRNSEKFNLIRGLYMKNLIVRYAKREELESVNKIRKQVNEVHVKGRPDIFREDGWQFIEPFIYTRMESYVETKEANKT